MKKFRLGFLGVLMFVAAAAANRAPNIIYILADDLGYGDLSCNGQMLYQTPNIDRIAREGMKFNQAYAGTSVCAPSRCSLMTGLDTGHTPIRGNLEVRPEGQAPMPGDTFTLARQFRNAGYVTGIFGKWGLGAPHSASEPLKMGFDRFYGYNCQRQAHHYYPYFLWNGNQREMLWGNFGLETGEYAPALIHEQAMQFIESNKDKPFFCFYTTTIPHAEMFAPEEYMAKYRGKFLPESSYEGTDSGPDFRKFAYGSQPEAHAAHAAMINCLDDQVGELLARLKELGIDDNTMIIFSSDNGPHTEGGNDPAYFHSAGPFRGVKRDLYEGGIRVPFLVRWPARVAPGSTTEHLTAFWDVLPTMAELTGQPIPANTDGVSFLPTLLGEKGQQKHDYLYWEFHEQKGHVAIRKENWKGVRYKVALDPDSPLELYDLSSDPGEQHNVAGQHPEVVAELDKLIKGARTVSPVEKFNFPLKRKSGNAARAHEK